MNILTAENLKKIYGDKVILDGVSFGIEDNEKVGIIGINGTGKSTLLKIIAGLEVPDSGEIIKMNGLKLGYLPQMPEFKEGTTVLNQVFNTDNEIFNVVKKYEEVLSLSEKHPENKEYEKRLIEISHDMDKKNAWGFESEAKTILTKLGVTDFDKDVSKLSGGQRKRIALAGALISPVDLLILDEPTNHIDNETVEWLEAYLAKYKKALLMVTHDRYFLDRVTNKIIETDRGNVYTYIGNYSKFLEEKAEREVLLHAADKKRQNFLRTELEWVRRGAQARSTKQKARLQRFEEINAEKSFRDDKSVEISVESSRLGKKTIIAENIAKSYDGIKYIDDFSYIVLKDDRIGIVGKNGTGKSTLLKMLSKEISPDSGTVTVGDTVNIGVFSQESDEMDNNMRVIDYIKEVAEYVPTENGRITASQMLEKFLFTPSEQWSYIGKLSGGEKRRLHLLRVLMGASNILFLDEPTNDLDIDTLGILEEYLQGFKGAVIAVSHDRYFLDKTVNRIFSFEGDAVIEQHEGNYTDYSLLKEQEQKETQKPKQKETKVIKKREKALKMTYNEQREFDNINDDIEKLEEDIVNVEKQIELSADDYVELSKLLSKKEELEKNLEEKMERWVYLNELSERIESGEK